MGESQRSYARAVASDGSSWKGAPRERGDLRGGGLQVATNIARNSLQETKAAIQNNKWFPYSLKCQPTRAARFSI